LPTGIAAITGTCTFGCEFFTAALADQILTAHLAAFPLPPIVGLIAAPVAVTVFLGVDGGVEHPTAAAADKFADGVSSGGKTRFLIRFFQIILIVLLPFFVCHIHGDDPPFTGVTEKQCAHFEYIVFLRNWEIKVLPFSLHGFPAPFRRRFPALPCGVIAVYSMQTVMRFSRFVADFAIKNRHTTT
jgi:hypothetical protein